MKPSCWLVSILFSAGALAGLEDFKPGPVIKEYGEHIGISTMAVDKDAVFKVAFDVAAGAPEPGQVNRRFNSLARFINMHAAAGVKPENIHLALVVHGGAAKELLDDKAFMQEFGTDNKNKPLLQALMANNVQVILCGQSAGAHDIAPDMLIDGVDVAISAMSAHAVLQQNGYTVNPF
ncbi:DsrE family protein [Aestuariibacter salexigens]|uniref:DsrE family protein n=1 Tax=Aestuariibacter salexigens TaxID=226010 RepID=UPI000417AEB7|nr:DsrE family protein [Aestuariibacter salexigens]